MNSAMEESLAEARDTLLDSRFKGVPLGAQIQLRNIGEQRWNVTQGDLALPVTTLRAEAVDHNIRAMAAYANRYGALLAPHGKTTMSPQLFGRQLEAGAWAITAATPSQAAIMRRFGVPRIFLANELVEPNALRWVAIQLADPDFDFYCLVDNPSTVALMDRFLGGLPEDRRLSVLVEVGVKGGRTGTRSNAQAVDTAEAVTASEHLQLAGIETYEGLAARGGTQEDLDAVDSTLDQVRDLVVDLWKRGLLDDHEVLVSAGGSVYFDRVVQRLGDWSHSPVTARLILRSGCYVSHDAGRYHRLSPLDGRRSAKEPLELWDALQAWAVVLSCPEPGLVILGAGKRDVPYDVDLPLLQHLYRSDGIDFSLEGRGSITGLMDQHAFAAVDLDLDIRPGDVVSLGLSHPCGAFEKSPLVPLLNDVGDVVDAILTYF
jgi:D-serine dehydratase